MEDRQIIYDVKEKNGLSQKELERLLTQWQVKLGMSDWKFDLKIVDFKRKNDYRQSGDFIAEPNKKVATILMTWDPWRGDEEYTLVHEMLHVLVYDYDKYAENLILENHKQFEDEHNVYMDKLENLVHHLTRTFLGRSDR